MEKEVNEVVHAALSLIVAALTLLAISFLLLMRKEIANARSEQKISAERMRMNLEYEAFDDKELTGSKVIAMVRQVYNNDDVDIFVDKDMHDNKFICTAITRGKVSSVMAKSTFTTDELVDSLMDTDTSYSNTGIRNLLANGASPYAEQALTQLFTATDKYQAYLVYDHRDVDLDNINTDKLGSLGQYSEVTGILVVKK